MSSQKATNDPWVPLAADGASGDLDVTPSGTLPASSFDIPEFTAPLPVDPLRQTIDSERYIQSLEKKLEKLKKARTKSKEPTSRDIITSLALFHDDQMRRFITASAPVSSQVFDSYDDSVTAISAIQRRLHPERQPLNAEEVVELVKDDVVAKVVEELEISDSEVTGVNDKLTKLKTVESKSLSSCADTDTSRTDNTICEKEKSSDERSSQVNEEGQQDVRKDVVDVPNATNATEENWADFDQMNSETG